MEKVLLNFGFWIADSSCCKEFAPAACGRVVGANSNNGYHTYSLSLQLKLIERKNALGLSRAI
jgi:hypothetical protein